MSAEPTAGVRNGVKAFAFTETPLLQFPCPIYRAGASWAMNSATASFIRKLKDAENRYLWQPALSSDTPICCLVIRSAICLGPQLRVTAPRATGAH